MSEEMDAVAVWGRYSRRRLRPGTSYPAKQSEIEDALRLANVRVGELIMWLRDDIATRRREDGGRIQLLAAQWTRSDTQLWIYALPSDRRSLAHALLVRRGLPGASRWLAEASGRGNAWAATRHEWAIFLVGDDLLVEES